jgi:hypothetical protein
VSATWQGHLPTQVELECSGASHWVRWEEGELFLLNHADAQGERTLAALAGERPPCIELLELWTRHVDDLRVLVLASRGLGDPLATGGPAGPQIGSAPPVAMAAPLRGQLRPVPPQVRPTVGFVSGGVSSSVGGVARSVPPRPNLPRRLPGTSRHRVEDPLADLISMAGPLVDRLVAGVAMHWAGRLASGDPAVTDNLPALEAALYGRACLAVRTWLGAPRLDVSVDMIPQAQEPAIARNDAGIEVSLPFNWINEVWARGLSVLMGKFVLSVEPEGGSSLLLNVASHDCSLSTMTISF